ncbi:MAG: hypothetical protein IKP40_01115 [Clostridia bacterium]|nr:hypothetical protein [Clostridia bacterium]
MRTTVAVLDFGTSKIVTLVAESSSTNRYDIIGAGIANYDGFSRDGWNNPGAVDAMIEQSITEAERQCKKKIHSIYVGIPATFTKAYPVETKVELKGTDPKVKQEDLRELFAQAEKSLGQTIGVPVHNSPAWFVIDGVQRTFTPVNQPGHELRALISYALADRFFLEEVNNRLTRMGYKVEGFLSSAVGEAKLFLPESDRDYTSVLIDVGYTCTDVIIAQGDAMIFCKTIDDLGGGQMSAALAEGLNIRLPDAEDKIKRSYVFGIETSTETFDIPPLAGTKGASFTRQQVNEVLLPLVDTLADEISATIEESGVRMTDKTTVYMTGGGLAMNKGARQYLSDKLGLTVREVSNKTTNLNTHTLSSSLGLLDLVMETVEQANAQQSGGRFSRFFKALMGG